VAVEQATCSRWTEGEKHHSIIRDSLWSEDLTGPGEEKGWKKGKAEVLQVVVVCEKCLEEEGHDFSILAVYAARLWLCSYLCKSQIAPLTSVQ